ncbi:metallophosphoesterase [Pontibacter sp. G13]|uniref:metallophosphoesterase n=1 Tax=Pontibacter sp. G13 TaxID=3074898 RepID=UPI002889BEE9|nr:metallophosphoesterase [Pontibacter sp. G13]WNJ21529.1 metallophosphoesterase [Pontibacter sp. G13]
MGKRWVVTDIHGCYKTMYRLLHQILKISKDDQLFMLGDFVSKGPSSAKVLDHIMDLQAQGYEVYPIRGNHEQKILDKWAWWQGEPESLRGPFAGTIKAPDLVDANGQLPQKYIDFLESLPYFIETDDVWMVHAGFDFHAEDPFRDTDAMMVIRGYEVDHAYTKGKPIIHGHTPTLFASIQRQLKEFDRGGAISLDNGCVLYHPKEGTWRSKTMGRLLALDLDTRQLYLQRNIDYVPKPMPAHSPLAKIPSWVRTLPVPVFQRLIHRIVG